MAAMNAKADVALLYNEDHDQGEADGITNALSLLGLRVTSYPDIPAGGSRLCGLTALIDNAWCVVLIVTDNFVRDNWSNYEMHHALCISIERGIWNVIPIKYCGKQEYPCELGPITGLTGSSDYGRNADRISKAVQPTKKALTIVHPERGTIEITYPELNGLQIIIVVTDALVDHYEVDKKLKALHNKMKERVDEGLRGASDTESPGECSCLQGELWKKEIGKEEYWAGKPEPLRNIGKAKGGANKHTDGIHALYNSPSEGYLKLASVFLTKRPLPFKQSGWNGISEFLDPDGILQLLIRCSAFCTDDEERKQMQQIRDQRNKVAHLPKIPTEMQDQFFDGLVKPIAASLYGNLPHKKYNKVYTNMIKIKEGKATLKFPEGSPLRREVDKVKRELAESNPGGIGGGDGGDGDGGVVDGGDGGSIPLEHVRQSLQALDVGSLFI